jgi:hypothetical protein
LYQLQWSRHEHVPILRRVPHDHLQRVRWPARGQLRFLQRQRSDRLYTLRRQWHNFGDWPDRLHCVGKP